MMTGQSMRLPEPHGLLLDRTRTITFEFEGEHFTGYRGDTIASALLANGQSVFSRSFKYHRPRGVLTMAGLDANTYVQIGDAPNQSADQVLITEGLSVQAQNVWGSLKFDRGRIFEAFARFMPVGFYYKAFYRPQGVWNYWEKLVRAASGLGKVHLDTPHGYYDKQYLFADVAVIGGGPAGLSAALKAAGAGAEVILIDEAETLGGSLNYAFAKAGQKRAQELKARALASSNLTILDQATCSGWFADNWLAATRSNRLYKIRATQVILATGLVEQPMVFRNNDLPGILLGSAAQRLIRLYGVRPGRKAVVAIGHPDGFAVVRDLVEVDIGIAAVSVLDQTDIPESERIFLEARKIPVIRDSSLYEAYANKKTGAVQAVKVQRINGRTVKHEGERIECDLVVTSVGYSPLGQLACHSGGRMIYDERLATLVIDQRPHASHLAGSVNGHHDIEAVIADGERAGAEAATALGFECDHLPMPDDQKPRLNHPFPIFPHPEGKDFVDFDEDQVTKDINNAVLDGFEQVELVKRYTTTGMGPSQGRHSALNVLRLTQFYRQTPTEQVMVTTQRPPFKPESFGHLAGRRFEPVRHTAAHQRHLELGATMMPAGLWMRPAFYGPKQGSAAQIAAEVKSVRKNVGLIDVSTLGGLEVRGPDAAEFLNRMYTFRYIKQPVGRSRYVLMTDQAGAIIDDGVACRLQEDHFYVTAVESMMSTVPCCTGMHSGASMSMLRM